MTRELREQGIDTPALLMGYVNPMLAYGLEQFTADAAAAGVDGLIVPDLPPEESAELETLCNEHGLALVYLLAPTSTPERIERVAKQSRGFIYLVSLTGVTGARNQLPPGLSDFVARVRSQTDTPLAVGFGIGNGEQARTVAEIADGVIVGSALVKRAGGDVERIPVRRVAAVDTTGAGDMYAAGFLYGLISGWTDGNAGLCASYLASRVVETWGAQFPPETRAAVAAEVFRGEWKFTV